MMVSTSNLKFARPVIPHTTSPVSKQVILDSINRLLDKHFASTLRQIDTGGVKLDTIILAQLFLESHFISGNVSSASSYSLSIHSGAQDYAKSAVITAKTSSPSITAAELANIDQAYYAWGLSQSMGWNHVRGASVANRGKCEIERIAARVPTIDSATLSSLLINPGESMTKIVGNPTSITGTPTPDQISCIDRQILSGLLILWDKSTIIKYSDGIYKYSSYKFTSHIAAAIGAYLGSGTDANGTTPVSYADNICNGTIYAQANGTTSLILADNSSTGRQTSPANVPGRQSISGCG